MEVHDFLQELPEELNPKYWDLSELTTSGLEEDFVVLVAFCPYCTALVYDPTLHLNHSPSCMEALAEANGKWEAEHGVAK